MNAAFGILLIAFAVAGIVAVGYLLLKLDELRADIGRLKLDVRRLADVQNGGPLTTSYLFSVEDGVPPRLPRSNPGAPMRR